LSKSVYSESGRGGNSKRLPTKVGGPNPRGRPLQKKEKDGTGTLKSIIKKKRLPQRQNFNEKGRRALGGGLPFSRTEEGTQITEKTCKRKVELVIILAVRGGGRRQIVSKGAPRRRNPVKKKASNG